MTRRINRIFLLVKIHRSSTSTDMKLLVVLIAVLVLVSGKAKPKKESKGCLGKGDDFYNLLSTMTPYDVVRGNIKEEKDCKPEGLWAFVRHATRFPHDKEIYKFANITDLRDEILQNHRENRGSLCPHDVELFSKWHSITDVNQNMLLTASGFEELRKFGERMKTGFKKLLKDYDSGDVEIKITSKERTRQSAEAFITGLYDSHFKIDNEKIHDNLIKNEGKCPEWKKSVKSDKLKEEVEKVKNSAEMQAVIARVGKTLGFNRKLDFEEVKDMYDLCGFEYAWYHSGKDAPWCSGFTDEDLKVMEFYEDVRYYYKSAYGNPLTKKLGCTHIQDIIERFSSGPKATFYFGHSMGNRKMLTTLGIGSGPLSGDGYSKSAKRPWMTSKLTPFAANVILVKYQCKKDKTRVGVYVNEHLTPIPACGGKDMCSLEEFKRAFSAITSPSFCNRDFCGNVAASGRSLPFDEDDDDDDDY